MCYGEKREQEEKKRGKEKIKEWCRDCGRKGRRRRKSGKKGGEKDKKKKKKKGLQKRERGEKGKKKKEKGGEIERGKKNYGGSTLVALIYIFSKRFLKI